MVQMQQLIVLRVQHPSAQALLPTLCNLCAPLPTMAPKRAKAAAKSVATAKAKAPIMEALARNALRVYIALIFLSMFCLLG
jgi:hypothetical protein